jgi:hypothetical protein
MNYLDENWKKYFQTFNDGLGTTYERFILHRYFLQIKQKYSIKNLIESPSFGMTGVSGINSVWWTAQGIHINIVDSVPERLKLIRNVWADLKFNKMAQFTPASPDSLPFQDQSFDMGWNFAALGRSGNPAGCIDEIARVVTKVLFICIPNESNIIGLLRSGKKSDIALSHDAKSIAIIKRLSQNGWLLEQDGYFDNPPWPDIAMARADILRSLGLRKLAAKIEEEKDSSICILNFFNNKNPNMEKEILHFGFLENAPRFIKKFWAHHRFLLFVRKNINVKEKP